VSIKWELLHVPSKGGGGVFASPLIGGTTLWPRNPDIIGQFFLYKMIEISFLKERKNSKTFEKENILTL